MIVVLGKIAWFILSVMATIALAVFVVVVGFGGQPGSQPEPGDEGWGR
jgi:hypothetical protein